MKYHAWVSLLLHVSNINFIRTFYKFFDLLAWSNNNLWELSSNADIKWCIKGLLKWSWQRADNQFPGLFWDDGGIWFIKWPSILFTISNSTVYYLIKTKMNLVTLCWTDPTKYMPSYWTNKDGGSTNSCKKNTPSIIITSMLAGLTEASPDSSSCTSCAVGVFFILPSKLARKGGIRVGGKLKPPPCRFFL